MDLSHNLIRTLITIIIYTNEHMTSHPSTSFVTAVDSLQSHYLNIFPNVYVAPSDVSKMAAVQTMTMATCAVLCLDNRECLSVSFNTDTKACQISDVTASTPGAVLVYNDIYKYTEVARNPGVEWHLAFRATQGIGVSVYETWMDNGRHDDVTNIARDTIGCLTIDNHKPCNTHFRTRRLDDWTNVALVKHVFYTDSQEVFYVTFNASGTTAATRDDHFRISKIVDSSATEMIGYSNNVNFESIWGHPDCARRFYLNHRWGGCGDDWGWMLVNDHGHHCCSYERIGPFPNFMYTPTQFEINWDTSSVGRAKVYAVYLKYED